MDIPQSLLRDLDIIGSKKLRDSEILAIYGTYGYGSERRASSNQIKMIYALLYQDGCRRPSEEYDYGSLTMEEASDIIRELKGENPRGQRNFFEKSIEEEEVDDKDLPF